MDLGNFTLDTNVDVVDAILVICGQRGSHTSHPYLNEVDRAPAFQQTPFFLAETPTEEFFA